MIYNIKNSSKYQPIFQKFDIQKNVQNKILSKFKFYCLGFDLIPNNR